MIYDGLMDFLKNSRAVHRCVVVLGAFFALYTATPALAADKAVAILLSREIAPVIDMVEGLENELAGQRVQRFFFDAKGQLYSLGSEPQLDALHFAAVVAIGPQALQYALRHGPDLPLFFGLVLNPQRFGDTHRPIRYGISLNIPPARQFAALRRQLPQLRTLGILFDPHNNQEWFDQALLAAKPLGIELLPLHVRRHDERIQLQDSSFAQVQAVLFIPDATIISPPVIRHLIQQAFLQRIPAIGYNPFFTDSGAAFSFLLNYQADGRRLGRQVKQQLISDAQPQPAIRFDSPSFELQRNDTVWHRFGAVLPVRKASP